LQPTCTSKPLADKMWAISAVVVDFPFVPVTAITGARPGTSTSAPIARAKISMSPITSTAVDFAFTTTGCGDGCVNGTPGDNTSDFKRSHGHSLHGAIVAPASAASLRGSDASSQARTRAPAAFSERTEAMPLRASPKTATSRFSKLCAPII
jgi:hypothetical protein